MSLPEVNLTNTLIVTSLLMLCVVPAYAQVEDITQTIMDDPVLKEKYGRPCTSINGIEFSSLPRQEVSLKERIDNAKDGEILEIPYGYELLTEPIDINKNMTVVGDRFAVLDTNHTSELFNITNSNANVKLENIFLVNGKGNEGGAIDSDAKNLTLVNCTLAHNIAYNGSGIDSQDGELHMKSCEIVDNFAYDDGTIILNGANSTIEDCLFENNRANGIGGCIYNGISTTSSTKNGVSSIYIVNSTFRRNQVTYFGSAIYSNGKNVRIDSSDFSENIGITPVMVENGSLVIKDCNIYKCSGPYGWAESGICGVLRILGCSAIIENCTIQNNNAIYQTESGFGGAAAGIFVANSNVIMNNTTVEKNEAFSAGGILVDHQSELVVNHGRIAHNVARYTIDGGRNINGNAAGILIWPGAKVTLNEVTFEDNHADNYGGAINNNGVLTLTGANKFMDNTASFGGAIYNGKTGQLTVKDKPYFINNKVKEIGGAIYNEGTMSLENAIFSDNEADYGSCIYNKGTLTEKDSLFYRNQANTGTIFNIGTMSMTGPDITENIAGYAGAIWNYGTFTINGGQITENEAREGDGGAIITKGGGTAVLNLNGTVLSHNTARGLGGAIYSTGITNLAYNNRARIFGNKAYNGGGIFVENTLGVNGALIRNNTAVVSGGGIFLNDGGSLRGVTSYVTDNTPDNIAHFKPGAPKTGNNSTTPLQKEAMRSRIEEIKSKIGTMRDQIEVIEGQVA